MKAITVKQPWAELIARGDKAVENRTWCTKWRGALAIHAGLQDCESDMAACWLARVVTPYQSYSCKQLGVMLYGSRGAIVAVCTLVDCVRLRHVPARHHVFAVGPWCWILSHVRRVHIPGVRGRQGLFEVPDIE